MMLAADYPLLGVFWSLLWIYLLVAWLVLLLHAVVDLVHNEDLRGVAKAAWFLAILIFPVLGVLVYTARHGDERAFDFGPSGPDKEAALRAYTDHGVGYGGRATGHY
jgi:hypothetical protein